MHQQDLKNRVTGAKNWRAVGEAKQKAGQVPEGISSYRQSLKLLPDAALEEHVRLLEGKQAEAGEKKASADKLWQEGTALFNQGRPSDALAKFKESLGYGSDATRRAYVADMEARRSKAVSLREQGAGLQGQKRIPEAIAKYKESLTYWPDPALTAHIATLEKSRAGDRPPTVVSGGVDGTWEVSFNNYRGKMELQRRSRWLQLMAEYKGRIDVAAGQKFLSDHFDTFAKKTDPNERSLCGHVARSARGMKGWQEPYAAAGAVQAKVSDSAMAEGMSLTASMGHSCGIHFKAADYLAKHPEFEWQKPFLRDMDSHPWTEFTILR